MTNIIIIFSGNISLDPEPSSANIFGGILAGTATSLLSTASVFLL